MTVIVFFDRAGAIVLSEKIEGGFSKDPRDRGNWTGGKVGVGVLKGTNHGISAAAYPDLDIVNLAREAALMIYRRDYWDRCRCDELPWPFALALFDGAVNQGPKVAIKLLQRAILHLAPGIIADGVIGPKTIKAVRSATRDDLAVYLGRRAKRYTELEDFPTFGGGRLTRLFIIQQEALT